MKYCRDCKWFRRVGMTLEGEQKLSMCVAREPRVDLVTGVGVARYARDERMDGACGADAKLFEPKSKEPKGSWWWGWE